VQKSEGLSRQKGGGDGASSSFRNVRARMVLGTIRGSEFRLRALLLKNRKGRTQQACVVEVEVLLLRKGHSPGRRERRMGLQRGHRRRADRKEGSEQILIVE